MWDFLLDPAPHSAYSTAHGDFVTDLTGPSTEVLDGALAQLGERLHGMQEVSGSIPLCSTIPYTHTIKPS